MESKPLCCRLQNVAKKDLTPWASAANRRHHGAARRLSAGEGFPPPPPAGHRRCTAEWRFHACEAPKHRASSCSAILAAALMAAPAKGRGSVQPSTPVKLPGIDGSGTEPRMTVGPDDTRLQRSPRRSARRAAGRSCTARSTRGADLAEDNRAIRFRPNATIDVDVVANGRRGPHPWLRASDEAGLNFPELLQRRQAGVSLDRVHAARRALADQEPPSGSPSDPTQTTTASRTSTCSTTNLGSGVANHKHVSSRRRPTAGGDVSGRRCRPRCRGDNRLRRPPVRRLGAGPSDIQVNPADGPDLRLLHNAPREPRVAPRTGTSAAARPCRLEFNIVKREPAFWVATLAQRAGRARGSSPVARRWTLPTGQVVLGCSSRTAHSTTPAACTSPYPESAKQYPDLSAAAAVKLVWQAAPRPAASWPTAAGPAPVTLVPPSDPASGGDQPRPPCGGRPRAYRRRPTTAAWPMARPGQADLVQPVYCTRPTCAHPTPENRRPARPPTCRPTSGRASEMNGPCAPIRRPVQGVGERPGLRPLDPTYGASRSTAHCHVQHHVADGGHDPRTVRPRTCPARRPATYVTTQSGGPTLCPSGPPARRRGRSFRIRRWGARGGAGLLRPRGPQLARGLGRVRAQIAGGLQAFSGKALGTVAAGASERLNVGDRTQGRQALRIPARQADGWAAAGFVAAGRRS